ncbi:hypothetical protein [Geodermatophilus nigrescens]|uniref:PH domain-containing protein n=1 Tax=Geodermatophilus nigrescens TaxID=1070870 RepID=A0A1M5QS45_9ACTN|nr:hypothetical protein [Geodermatophilus nigrescens]SHH16711.1 hypothetical protein SAMN05444351_4158 [Geodermatophilus nigrescens]
MTVELRPRPRYLLAPALLLLVAAQTWLGSREEGLPPGGVLVLRGLALLVAAAAVVLVLRRPGLRLTSDAVVHRRFRGTRVVPRGDLASLVCAPRVLGGRSGAVLLALLDRDGRALVRLQSTSWDPGEVEAFARATGLPGRFVPELTSLAEIARLAPEAVSEGDRRPVRHAALALGALLLLAAGVTAALLLG